MKTRHLFRICLFLAVLTETACSDGDHAEPRRTADAGISIELPSTLEAADLACPLCLFRRSAGSADEYRLAALFTDAADGSTLKLGLEEVIGYDCRFLAVAQKRDAGAIKLTASDGSPLAIGGAWADVRLACPTEGVSGDAYFGVRDLAGDEIVAAGKVQLFLTRIAGRFVFDFYRIATSLDDPQGVVSDAVSSVLDRVTEIAIEYEGLTSSLRFDARNRLIPDASASEPLLTTIRPKLTGFGVALPQSDLGLEVYDAAVRGSARIMGAFALPASERVRIHMTFKYFDTTPLCGNDHTGDHTQECYGASVIALDLPAAGSAAGLPVDADCFTVSRAGLRCDRVIDVPLSGSVGADFSWL